METNSKLPEYECFKKVRAAKITSIQGNDLFLGDIPAKVIVTDEWLQKHPAEVGGYFVVYNDGYTSYSPGKAFEEGYRLVV